MAMAKYLFVLLALASFARQPVQQFQAPVVQTVQVSDTTKPFLIKGKPTTEREMDSLINLSIKKTMDSLRKRGYIVKQ